MRHAVAVVVPELFRAEGGIAAFSRMFIESLDRILGEKVGVISRNDRLSDFPNDFLAERVVFSSGEYPRKMRPIVLFANCAKSRFTNFISTHPNFLPALDIISLFKRIQFSSVAHGIDVWGPQSVLRKRGLVRAERLFPVSKFTADKLIEVHGINPNRIRIFQNTIDESRFNVKQGTSLRLRERYGIQVGEKVILTIGRLSAQEGYKGYDRIIHCLAEVQEQCGPTRYVIGGRGDDCNRVKKLASNLGVLNQVVFAGFIPDEELASHYRMADVFAMPSTGEGFGIVFLEAMACGVPVLAGNRDGSVDALANGELGMLVDPLDTKDIASGLKRILSRDGPTWWYQPEELRRRMIEKFGRARFEQRLSEVIREITPSLN